MAEPKPTETPDPTIGRIVHYTLTENDVRRLDNDRLATLAYGNLPHAGDVVSAVVVATGDERTINAQAFMDGNDRLWVANVPEGDEPGQWHYPARS